MVTAKSMNGGAVDEDNELTGRVIGAAIGVHRELGPGVEEAAYEEALSARLNGLGIPHECQKPLPLEYKGVTLDCGFRLDVLVENRLPIELKAVDTVLPVHEAQLLTYMRLSGFSLGLLINFEVPVLKNGIQRKALTNPRNSTPSFDLKEYDGFDCLSTEIVRAALEVHRVLGPGLVRSVYEECLCHELGLQDIGFTRKFHASLPFDGHDLTHSVEIPLVVAGRVPVFCLSVSKLTELHQSRLLARLRQTEWPYGFLLNFNAATMSEGLRRLTLK